jgi:hypothetical protein
MLSRYLPINAEGFTKLEIHLVEQSFRTTGRSMNSRRNIDSKLSGLPADSVQIFPAVEKSKTSDRMAAHRCYASVLLNLAITSG